MPPTLHVGSLFRPVFVLSAAVSGAYASSNWQNHLQPGAFENTSCAVSAPGCDNLCYSQFADYDGAYFFSNGLSGSFDSYCSHTPTADYELAYDLGWIGGATPPAATVPSPKSPQGWTAISENGECTSMFDDLAFFTGPTGFYSAILDSKTGGRVTPLIYFLETIGFRALALSNFQVTLDASAAANLTVFARYAQLMMAPTFSKNTAGFLDMLN